MLVQTGSAADAVTWFERAIKQEPDFYEAKLNLGIALQESGQREKRRRRLSRDSCHARRLGFRASGAPRADLLRQVVK